MSAPFQLAGIILAACTVLIWNQPAVLLRLAAWLERKGALIIREIRVRALAKAAAQRTYRNAVEYYRERTRPTMTAGGTLR